MEGPGPLFCCTEIRQRGPVPLTGAACRKPCGIAQVMRQAERAWRQELASTTIADLVETSGTGAVTGKHLAGDAPPGVMTTPAGQVPAACPGG